MRIKCPAGSQAEQQEQTVIRVRLWTEKKKKGAGGGGRGREGQEEVRPVLKSAANVLMANFGEDTLIPLAQKRLSDNEAGKHPLADGQGEEQLQRIPLLGVNRASAHMPTPIWLWGAS